MRRNRYTLTNSIIIIIAKHSQRKRLPTTPPVAFQTLRILLALDPTAHIPTIIARIFRGTFQNAVSNEVRDCIGFCRDGCNQGGKMLLPCVRGGGRDVAGINSFWHFGLVNVVPPWLKMFCEAVSLFRKSSNLKSFLANKFNFSNLNEIYEFVVHTNHKSTNPTPTFFCAS